MSDSPRIQFLLDWVNNHSGVERFTYGLPVRSVAEAVEVSGIDSNHFIKSICLKNKDEDIYVIAIITAGSKVDKRRLLDGVGPKRWLLAPPEDILSLLGFPAGGVPPVCIDVNPQKIHLYVDPRVLKKDFVIGGGGSKDSLLKLPPYLILEDGANERIISFG